MRRFSIVLLVLIVSVMSLAKAKTIEIWWIASNEEIRVAKDLIETKFTPKTGIEVDIKIAAWEDHFEKALLALAAGDCPDIVMTRAAF